jgi:2-oxoglutarate ferredoxin oxidoreductase subunit beta
MLIPLRHDEPIVFGPEGHERGVAQRSDGGLEIVNVGEAGTAGLLVHDEKRDDPGLAFALSRLARGPYEPTPIGVFRAVARPEYGAQMSEQIVQSQAKRGLGDVAALLRSGSSWTVQ